MTKITTSILIFLTFILTACIKKTLVEEVKPNDYALIAKNPLNFVKNNITLIIPENKRILEEKKKILQAKQSFQYTILRSEPYIYYILNQLKARNMPAELALIPLIESAYNPLATSNANAAGLWQIVPITAKEFGLETSQWYDQRRDLIESTNVALDYLQKLNLRYKGDWLLTLASYNTGTQRVNKAINWNQNKNLPSHFWALNLPKETMEYVPKFLAIIELIKNNESYQIELPNLTIDNSLVRFDLDKHIKLENVAKYSGVPLENLLSYNAGNLKKIARTDNPIFMPSSFSDFFEASLKEKNIKFELSQLTLNDDPNFVKTSVISPKITSNKYRYIGDKELIFYENEHKKHSKITYLIKSGDNLINIAKKFKVKVNDIMKWNNIEYADKLNSGKKITIYIKNY